jgi:hypothetical protein
MQWPGHTARNSNKKAEGREGEKERKKIACKGMRCGFGVYTGFDFDRLWARSVDPTLGTVGWLLYRIIQGAAPRTRGRVQRGGCREQAGHI